MNEYTLEKIRHDAAIDAMIDAHVRNGESWCGECGWDMRREDELPPLAVGWDELCKDCAIDLGAVPCDYCGEWDHEADGEWVRIGWVCAFCVENRPECMI
jgi:hypothetical protein